MCMREGRGESDVIGFEDAERDAGNDLPREVSVILVGAESDD